MRRYSLPPLLPDVAVLHPVRSWLPHRVAEVFVLGRLDSIADPPATKRVGEILSRATKENFRPAAAPVTLDTIVARREERGCRQKAQ